ncbi:glycosyltransferase family 2 protein [Streptomyces sp. M92]|uniref:glycosyltransferase family 2 protein n=1 Tax=Streptomyces sp. M92 TaxID=2944250 RepID=UPI0023495B5C|nr:glycosyltransferase [Streptomyces sp. M92]WCN01271.1 glycosyltransferase [Streptomyces sp. M92]
MQPRVSVIVPAYNAMPELTDCITSAMEQTIGLDQLEIIAVNDGSTDGTGKELDRLAATCTALRVIHQENSGNAAVPRNVALDVARGEYVFFLDSDDYLGPDALRRMVAMADENDTDIVLGKMVSVGGRAVPTAVFKTTQPRTDIFSSAAYRTLGCWKLFRRSLLERLNLRFPSFRNTEDKPFTAAAYLNANGVSVVADYDCYYHRDRANGNNLTLTAQNLSHRMQGSRMCFETVARYLEPGPRRDQIMRRHVEWELCGPLWWLLLRESEQDVRESIYPEIRDWVENWVTDPIIAMLESRDRVLLHLLRADRFDELMTVIRNAKEDAGRGHVVEGGRVYWQHPLFRDTAVGVPDSAFDVTGRLPVRHRVESVGWQKDGALRLSGHAYIENVASSDPATELVLRCYDADHPEVRVPARVHAVAGLPDDERYANAGFVVDIAPATAAAGAPLGRGRWNLFLDIRAQGVSRVVRLKSLEAGRTPPQSIVTTGTGKPTTVTPYVTKWGNLSLNVGREVPRDDTPCRVTKLAWHRSRKGTLTVTGTLAERVDALRLRVENATGDRREVTAPISGTDGGFSVELPLRTLRPGRWTVTLSLPGASPAAAVPYLAGLGRTHWFHLARPYTARPVKEASETTLVVEVRAVDVRAAVRRRLRRAARKVRG